MKVCKECNIEKNINEFYLKPNGKPRTSFCKECYSKIYKPNKEKKKEYYQKNREKIYTKYKEYIEENDRTDYQKEYRSKNREKLKEKNKKYREENKELIKKRKSDYWNELDDEQKKEINNRKKELYHNKIDSYRSSRNIYVNKKMKEDTLFKLKFNIRTLIRNGFKRKYLNKSKKTSDILGCSFDEFKNYIESKFEHWMNWDNYGLYNGKTEYGWDIDHIIPLYSAKTEEDIIRLNHYTNLQPLDSYINRNIKRHKVE